MATLQEVKASLELQFEIVCNHINHFKDELKNAKDPITIEEIKKEISFWTGKKVGIEDCLRYLERSITNG